MPSSAQVQVWRELADAATEGPWWQRSHLTPEPPDVPHCDKCGNGAPRELSDLLCYFEDEGEPRFWSYDTDGVFVAASRAAVPEMAALLEWAMDEINTLSLRLLLEFGAEPTAETRRKLVEWRGEEVGGG